MKKEFKSDFGVYCCPHVFKKTRPVLLVIRDPEGDWQFLCGEDDDLSTPHHLGVGHLLEADASLKPMANLDPGFGAERSCKISEWEEFEFDG